MVTPIEASRRYSIYALFVLDGIWWCLWIAFMHWFMLGSDGIPNMIYIREAFWKLSSHFFLALALATAWKETGEGSGRVSVVAAFWIFFAIFIDLYTVYDTFHVIGEHVVETTRLQALQALAVMAVVFSGLGLVAYFHLLYTQPDRKYKKHNQPTGW